MPSGTSTSIRCSLAPAVTAARSALRARYWRYQRHAQESAKPTAAATTIRPQAVGVSLLSSSFTSASLRDHRGQRGQLRLDLNARAGAREQRRQALGHRHLAPDERLDDLRELRRVRGADEHPAARGAPLGAQALPGLRRGCRVRAPDLPVLLVADADAGADLLIR